MLEDMRVLDFSHYIPGPFASMRLADLGAQVIKVEPLYGDLSRQPVGSEHQANQVFNAYNRLKKSIAVDLKSFDGLRAIHELIYTADVIIESFRPGVMKKLGLDYDRLRKDHPSLIYCSLSGYGQEGSLSSFGSHDINYMALSGLLSQLKDREGRPVHPTVTIADLIGGLAANESILAAYIQKEKTGEGAYVDAALLDSVYSFMNLHTLTAQQSGGKNGLPLLNGEAICYSIYETSDHRYICLAALEHKFWERFCQKFNKKEWLAHPFLPRTENHQVVREVIQLFKERTFKEWEQISLEVDCCLTPVYEVDEIHSLSYVQERMRQGKDKSGFIHIASRYPRHQAQGEVSFPALGEHTEEVFSTLLSYSKEEIKRMKDENVIL